MLTFTTAQTGTSLTDVIDEARALIDERPFAWPFSSAETSNHFIARLAADRATRDRAYTLAYDVYSAHGYAKNDHGRLVWPYDAEPSTLTLLIEDDASAAVATATLAYRAQSGLPADRLFPGEMAALRARGRTVVEVCRLCIADGHRHDRAILLRLINLLYIHAACIGHADDAVIEVHPCRARWYMRNLGFEQLGGQRACPSVGGQPTVLLRCDLAHYARRMGTAAHESAGLLYPEFYPWLEEGLIAEALARNASPMPAEEAAWFGIARVPTPSIAMDPAAAKGASEALDGTRATHRHAAGERRRAVG